MGRQDAGPRVKHWITLALLVGSVGALQAQDSLFRAKLLPVVVLDLDASLDIRYDSLRATPGGVYYDDRTLGNGESVRVGDQLAVRFVGFLADGTMVTESTVEPIRFRVGERKVIAGWEDGVLGMRVGGRRQLIIVPALGYGDKASGPIPPRSTLVFDIIIVDRLPD